MVRRKIIFCVLLAAAMPAFGQTKPRLAILPFTGENREDAESIAEFFSFEGEIRRVFTPVPRTRAIETLMREQDFQRSGLTDSDTIAELGKQLGADYVLAGHIAELDGSKLLLITIIDVQELQQIAGDYREYQQIERVVDILPGMAKKIAAAAGRDTSKLPRLAVLPFNTLSSGMNLADAELLAQLLATELANGGQYAVFPRTKEIEKVMELHHIERSGMTDPESMKQIGVAVNAQYVLSANVRRLGADNYFSASILHIVEASQGAGVREKYRDVRDGLTIMPKIAWELTGTAPSDAEVPDAEAFARAVAAVNQATTGGPYTITLTGSFDSAPVVFTAPGAAKTVILRGGGTQRVVKNGGMAAFITVRKGVTLTLEGNLVLDGNSKEARLVEVNSGGTLVMKAGSTLRGSKGGGVFVYGGGSFTMSGGTISGNSTAGTTGGGGVIVSGGSFAMSGGTINGNTAYGGGGAFVYGGSFTMSGGTISGNTAGSGGGVYVGNSNGGGSFTMSGGTISGNTASSGWGGGVYVGNSNGGGSFTMTGGIISGNTASSGWGGGVNVYNGGFTMSGGTIGGNTGTYGGGVYVNAEKGGSFVKKGGGTIDASKSATSGKAVYVYRENGSKQRNAAAGAGVNLDSGKDGSAGGWEAEPAAASAAPKELPKAEPNAVVRDAEAFARAVAAINGDTKGGDYTITLTGSFITSPVVFSTSGAAKTIVLVGDGTPRTLWNNGNRPLFTVPTGVSLTLDNNLTLDGNSKEARLMQVNSGGTLVMKAGSTLRGSKGGGVLVYSGGSFTMSGGTISGNTANSGGGGVSSGGSFTMSGGTINGNTAYTGGGAFVYSGSFTMSGGTISGNTANSGGGVDVGNSNGGGSFTMTGGTISGNTASDGWGGGGGVRVYNGSFTMTGGTIGGNTGTYGGGVSVYNGSFTMTGGTIGGNTAHGDGGGVHVGKSGSFVKKGGGTINAANSATGGGNVVYVVYTTSYGNYIRRRNAAAGAWTNLDSGKAGKAGGWE